MTTLIRTHRRQGDEWGGRSQTELQNPHKSRLVREQEAWAKAVRHVRSSIRESKLACALRVIAGGAGGQVWWCVQTMLVAARAACSSKLRTRRQSTPRS